MLNSEVVFYWPQYRRGDDEEWRDALFGRVAVQVAREDIERYRQLQPYAQFRIVKRTTTIVDEVTS